MAKPQKMTGGQAMARQLVLEGITDLFGIPGVQLDWATDGLRDVEDKLRFWVPRHEQTASYMADGYARSTGKIGACMVVPGPGMLNAMAGLATAWACNSPVLAIIGQIPSAAIGKGFGLLHEIQDQSQTLGTVTKWHAMAKSPADVPLLIREAVKQLRTGRPRPVAVEIPADILAASAEVALIEPPANEEYRLAPDAASIEEAAKLLDGARYPLIYAGGGCIAANASAALTRLADKLGAPVVMSDYGHGALSDRHPLALSTLGGRAVFPHADVVLVVGSRFADSGTPNPSWPQDKIKFIYLNTDTNSWAPPRKPALTLCGDATLGLALLADAINGGKPSRASDVAKVRAWCEVQMKEVQPQYDWMHAFRGAIPDDGIFVQDLTQVCYYSRALMPLYHPRTSITPGHQGTLGFAFPTALGVAAGNPDRAVVSASGDGGFGYAISDLATAAKYKLGLVAVVFNDGQFANVKNAHKATFGRSTAFQLSNPDFAKLAEAFGVKSAVVRTPAELAKVLPGAIASREPWLIDAQVGDMGDPWHLIRLNVTGPVRGHHVAPPNPLGDPAT
ncbi:MAG: thiamine pyrophosphate-dependent enzyme [Burkholderiales bacterium]